MKKYAAELIGTFILVLFGTGAGIIDQQTGGSITHLGTSATWGLAVTLMIYAFGDASGAHINPAVSIAFTLAGRFKAKLLPGYIICQLAGAVLASLTLKAILPTNKLLGATMPSGGELQSLLLETLLAFILMLVILVVADRYKERGTLAGLAIGAVVGLEAFFAGPICGASMNPARSIGPAIASGHLEHLWIYVVAPVVGMGLAVVGWRYVQGTRGTHAPVEQRERN